MRKEAGNAMIKRVEQAAMTRVERRRIAAASLAALMLLCAVGAVYAVQARTAEVVARKRELPVYSVERSDPVIAISFDAAWGGDKTLKLLDILDEYGVKTTFFVVDTWVQRYPELVKEVAARGHEIGNHSTTHPQMTKLSRDGIRQELSTVAGHIEELTGSRPTLFRPPYGDYNNDVVLTARAMG